MMRRLGLLLLLVMLAFPAAAMPLPAAAPSGVAHAEHMVVATPCHGAATGDTVPDERHDGTSGTAHGCIGSSLAAPTLKPALAPLPFPTLTPSPRLLQGDDGLSPSPALPPPRA